MGAEVFGEAGFQSLSMLARGPKREPQGTGKPHGQCGEEEAWKTKPTKLVRNVIRLTLKLHMRGSDPHIAMFRFFHLLFQTSDSGVLR